MTVSLDQNQGFNIGGRVYKKEKGNSSFNSPLLYCSTVSYKHKLLIVSSKFSSFVTNSAARHTQKHTTYTKSSSQKAQA